MSAESHRADHYSMRLLLFVEPYKQYFLMSSERTNVNKANLLDMFGLSGDPAADDELGALLFGLESETPKLPDTDSMAAMFPSMTCLHFDI